MVKIYSSFALLSVVPALGIVILIGGCSPSESIRTRPLAQLLVHIENGCPTGLPIENLASCDPAHAAPDVACRNRTEKITWLAVKGASPPYQPDTSAQFTIDFVTDPTEGRCKKSTKGVVDCKIKSDAATSTYYTYSFDNCPSGDPRVYVP